ncbi:TlpA family protein disulfide reductase [Rikenella microfusus]|uniref:TlpA family protein disulfide reductase n=1 Tax=Rikenella microfusus TaxID=28139 RepID=UPI00248E24F4|nr:TlpA disulfide reductase family protein [Rikenella microfusus]
MRILRLSLAVCAAALLAACGGEKNSEEQRTVVAGEVINRTEEDPNVVIWNLCDPIVNERMGQRLADDGSFRFETDGITCLHNATLVCGDFINLFVAPGDSVHLTIDAAKMRTGEPGAVRFGGAHAEDNDRLSAIMDYAYDCLYNCPEPLSLDFNAAPEAMLVRIRERTGQTSDSVEAYARRAGIVLDDTLRDFVRRDLIFALANQLLEYKYDDPQERLALFGDPLFGIHDTANFRSMMYPYHLLAYMQTKIEADTAVAAAWERRELAQMVRGGIRILSEEPATRSRDVMMWQFLTDRIDQNPELYDSVPELKSVFTDPSLGERLEAWAGQLKAAPVFPDMPVKGVAYLAADSTVVEVPEGDIFAYLTAKYPGKVLYIDVYATWCGPCRVEMKEAPALHKLMQGKDVVFVNLCLASDRETWLRFVAQQRPEGENYWFDEDATNLFMGTYSLDGYPTYILVGRDGKIATMKAERPSALAQASEHIDDLLAR